MRASNKPAAGLAAERPTTVRMEYFSDAVMAIVLTIMVIELKVPPRPPDQNIWEHFVLPLTPKLAAFALSFAMIAVLWVNHHHLMHTARYATRGLMWLNNHLLFWLALIPFSTAYAGHSPFSPFAIALYGFVMFWVAGAWALLRMHIGTLERSDRALKRLHSQALTKNWIALALYAASVPLAFLSIWISIAIFVIVPAIFFLPDPLPTDEKVEAPKKIVKKALKIARSG